MTTEIAETKVTEVLGHSGRMVGGSKSRYSDAHPENLVVFNANIVLLPAKGKPKKIWYGDLDLTLDLAKLKEVSRLVGKIAVLHEMDARFDRELTPNIEKAVVIVDGKKLQLSEEMRPYYNGRLKKHPREKIDKLLRESGRVF